MKQSGAPDVGDLVIAKEDTRRGILCLGIVLQCRGIECQVMWGSTSLPVGWWKRNHLEVVNEEEG